MSMKFACFIHGNRRGSNLGNSTVHYKQLNHLLTLFTNKSLGYSQQYKGEKKTITPCLSPSALSTNYLDQHMYNTYSYTSFISSPRRSLHRQRHNHLRRHYPVRVYEAYRSWDDQRTRK
ncbi:hypothetical protein V6Z11_A11G222000 [Gossypium hirsutum]